MAAPSDRRSPNILLVVADDHRFDCLHGDRIRGPVTPVLDRLAAGGTSFSRARIMGGDNAAVCVPSRTALFTGCCARRALVMPRAQTIDEAQTIRAELPLLGEVLGAAGYRTHVVGKWHNDRGALNRCFSGGAAVFLRGMWEHRDIPLHAYDPTGVYAEAREVCAEGFSTEVFADAAIDFIETHADGARPFFLHVGFTSPHDPRTPPENYRRRYDAAHLTLPANFMTRHPFDNGELGVRDETLLPVPRDPGEVRDSLADYYAMIEHHDHHMGRILSALERKGELEGTVVVYMSDHGLALGSHGLLGKQNLYEHSLRVPLIVSGPGIGRGRVIGQDVYAHRVFATLCELAGVKVPAEVEVPSLPFDEVRAREEEGDLHFAHYRDLQLAATDGRWKLIDYRLAGEVREQLFDLWSDPEELNDLAGRPEAEPVRRRLGRGLDAWWRRMEAPVEAV